ncbi:Signal transduction histidine kinase [Haloarcula vallismortis]|uniref:histidine kinase n=2 Tax=Haloarcula vallismortis TaxID=28442 RepID=M0J145_HALVA|nr:ATP-binding protein [Haloarcula vallismortis]EMA02043.1 HTR-like protein [Haloarcula vallismortis ATCC 29715]SDW99299.1 Signal transduction histidine kinase [Haloarcula vallismortis]
MTGGGDEIAGSSQRDGLRERLQTVLPSMYTRNYAVKFAVALAVIVIVLAAVGFGSYLQIQNRVVSDATTDLETSATHRADSIEQWRATTEAEATTIAAAGVYDTGTSADIRQYLTTIATAESSQTRSLHYVSTVGDSQLIVASTGTDTEGRTPWAVEPAWKSPVLATMNDTSSQTVVQSTAYADGDGHSMAFVAPTSDGDGALVLVARVPTEQFGDGHSGFETKLLTEDGDPLIDGQDGSAPLSQDGLRAATAGRTTTIETGSHVTTYAPVNGTSWVVVTSAERESLYGTGRLVRLGFLAVIGTAVVLLGVAGYLFGRHTVRPLVRLRDRTQAMKAGDLSVDISTARQDEIGRLYDAFGNMRDTLRSQIRQAQAAREEAERSSRELERQNERLDEFASTLSHDLRNPLTVARGHVELLATRLSDPEADSDDLQSHIEKLEDAHDRIESIIDDVLTLTRKGASVEETAPVPLAAVVTDAWDNIDNKSASIEVTGSRTIDADRTRLLRAFENLFRNAIDHVGPEVTVTVGLTEHGFYVADNGPGIPTDAVDNIFEYGHTTSEDGTGLGLSIVKTIAEAHGWRLYIDTTYPDGAMFVFADVFSEDEPDWYGTEFEWGRPEADD